MLNFNSEKENLTNNIQKFGFFTSKITCKKSKRFLLQDIESIYHEEKKKKKKKKSQTINNQQ